MKNLFPSLPEAPKLADVFRRFPKTIRPLLEYHDLLLRTESDLTIGQRELIAAYVSGLNACRFCFNGHVAFAHAYGIDPTAISALVDDFDNAPVENSLRPILRYVRKLTETPAMMTEADAQAVYNAGWSEDALFDAVQVCALFNLMNRIVEGTGVQPFAEDTKKTGNIAPSRLESYLEFGKSIGVA